MSVDSSQQYVVNTPDVVAEVIEGELVAIQLRTGCYYHANRTGGMIWNILDQGGLYADAEAVLRERFGISEEDGASHVRTFIDTLLTEQLIRPALEARVYEPEKENDNVVGVYEQPILKKHEDMRELLLLDPIHDVGEATWPMQPA